MASSISSYNGLDFGLLSGSITFTGLGSGTDFGEVVDQLVELESIHKYQMETWKETWEAKIASIKSLNQRLGAVGQGAGDMDTLNEFLVRAATSSDSSVVSATASSEASTGAYNVTVGSNIQHILSTAGVAATTTVVSASVAEDLVLSINGTSHTINIAANRTLSEVVDDINAYFDAAANEVDATIEYDGTSSRPYRLILTSNVGGAAGKIEVLQSPLLISLDTTDAVLFQNWSDGATTTSVSLGGHFSGDAAETPGGQGWFQYTISLADAGDRTVGTDEFTLNWSVTTASGVVNGSVTVPATYQPGDNINIHNGINIQLSQGLIKVGDSFEVLAYANDIDDPEGALSGTSTASTSGNYMGTQNKTYRFTVQNSGTVGTDTITLRWVDSDGQAGTISVAAADTAYEVEQGVYVSLSAGTMVKDDTFEVNVFAPDRQSAQDSGLAQVTKVVHSGFADLTTTPVTSSGGGDKTFTYVYAGEEINVTVDAGANLSQLVNLINNDANNPGVQASIVNDGLGLPDSYKLVLTGENTGAAHQITYISHDFDGGTFDGNSFTGDGGGGDVGGGFTRTQWATNAMVQVDGYPTGSDYLQRQSNQISDVITGVTLDLHDTGSATVTVSTDINAVGAKIEAFINAVNYAQDFIRQETKYDPDGEETGILIGNYSYQIIKSRMDTILNSSISGLVDGVDTYVHLSQIGIKTDPDDGGRWTLDPTALIAALNTDAEAVANLFVNNTSKSTQGVAKQMYDEMKAMTNSSTGMLAVLSDNYTNIVNDIDKRIEREDARLTLVRERLTLRFARLEATLAELNAQADSLESQINALPAATGKDNS